MAFEDWSGDYLLKFGPGIPGCSLEAGNRSRTFRREIAERISTQLRSLNSPGSPSAYISLLKEEELIIPEMAEIGSLDVSDPAAREAFIRKWDFSNMSREAGLELFSYRSLVGQFDKKKLIRNVVFQIWRWIKLGILPPIDNVVRRGWYQYVKRVLQNWRTLEATDYHRYFNELRELTRIRELGMVYRDFGFLDHERGLFYGPGTKHPEIVLYCEKSESKVLFDELQAEVGASYMINHGQPQRFRVEDLALDLVAQVPDKVIHLVSLVDFNPGGFAIEGAGLDGLAYHGLKPQVHRVLELRALSPDEVDEYRAPLAEAIRFDDGRPEEYTVGTKQNFDQCENWFQDAVQDDRFREVTKVSGGVQTTYYGFDGDVLGNDWFRNRMRRVLRRLLETPPATRSALPGEPGGFSASRWIRGYREDHGLRSAGRSVRVPDEDLGALLARYDLDPPRYG